MGFSETDSRTTIDYLLDKAGWLLRAKSDNPNVFTSYPVRYSDGSLGEADYVLMDSGDSPLCVIEAKKELISPLAGKEQARGYAEALDCRFVILSNGVTHYFWDIQQGGSPTPINAFYRQQHLELRRDKFHPHRDETEAINDDYLQKPDFKLRDYQKRAVKKIQQEVAAGKDRFLLAMATGTGKTLVAAALIRMFLRNRYASRVLFLVDRLELEEQAHADFTKMLQPDYQSVIWKDSETNWHRAKIVISTTQTLIINSKYSKIFRPDQFDLVISDEAHRSLGTRSRKVFEYFIGFKLGLTATPHDFLKGVDLQKLSYKDPRQLERRVNRDTYTTFGCDDGEPTFRYTLDEGAADDYLVNPVVYGVKTEKTTAMLSENGLFYQGLDEDGKEVETTFGAKDFERKFYSDNTNRVFCETFLQNALRDPYTGEIGKTLIFCVSQAHAANITQILNEYANSYLPERSKRYIGSDFAVQVSSNVTDAQRMAAQFRNNQLNGSAYMNEYYLTSKTRVCVTVDMMTTGYNCADILNICLMRPVYSASAFIQIKGRGTRTYDFTKELWLDKKRIPPDIDPIKHNFHLFDFFNSYEYFEHEFDYAEKLKLPPKPAKKPEVEPPPINIDDADSGNVVSTSPDPLKSIKQTAIGAQGMRVDRDLFAAFRDKVKGDRTLTNIVKERNFSEAQRYLQNKIFEKPEEFFNLSKLGKDLNLDRKPTVRELLLLAFGHIQQIPTRAELIAEEFDQFDEQQNLTDDEHESAKVVFKAYITNAEFRKIIDSKRYGLLSTHPLGAKFNQLSKELKQAIPDYIKQNIDIDQLQNA